MIMTVPMSHETLPAPPVHAKSPTHPPPSLHISTSARDSQRYSRPTELTRSATYTYLGSSATDDNPTPNFKRNFSDNALNLSSESKASVRHGESHMPNVEVLRRTSRKMKRKVTSAKRFSLSPDDDDDETSSSGRKRPDPTDLSRSFSRSVAGTFRSLARKSWAPTSRTSSSSPSRKIYHDATQSSAQRPDDLPTSPITLPEPAISRPHSPMPPNDTGPRVSPVLPKPNDQRLSQRQLPPHQIQTKSKSEISLKRLSRASSSTSLRSFTSTDRSRSRISLARVPPLPSSLSSDRLATLSSDVPKKKDPLWSAFRAIDGEYITFQSKTSLQKAKVLRTSLLPFLSKHQDHPSNSSPRPEDLDRRIATLNKWWVGLLELLNGFNSQTISGTDRPVFLEAVTAIMLRPEWQAPGFAPNSADSPRRPSLPKTKSSNSLESDDTDFLIDSVHHNVRNVFVQNLLSQMAFVVDRLSMRTAPASLVTFAGKTCAYAFFFCPGVADMLTRLWRLPPGTLRRVFSEFGSERGDRLDLVSKALSSNFPPPVRSLTVVSQTGLSRHLQRRLQYPPGSNNIAWYGPWVTRWCGRDSDLFFVFVKQFHVLVAHFLCEDVPSKDRVGIPGFVPVCAQLLVVLETTVYRSSGQAGAEGFSSGLGHNLENPDASAPLPMTIANATRSISENRLVMLLRDICSEHGADQALLRTLFISSFDAATKATARKISLYNNDACFVICDFMEEVLPILFRYSQHSMDAPILDWSFWLQVCQRMIHSHTTLTQIRLIAFLYSTWSIWTLDEQRKRAFVLEWLLDPLVFEPLFCHWSSMVRHYFYRFLCWRIARYDGEITDLDIEIIQTLATRLNKLWAHFQYLKAEAEMRDTPLPSFAPCSPAPNRHLIIVRTDSQPIMSSSLITLDKVIPASAMNQSSPYQSHSSALNSIPQADNQITPNGKKRWSVFRGLNMFGATGGNQRPGEVTPPGSPDEPATSGVNNGKGTGLNNAGISKQSCRPTTPPHQVLSFKFSLEWSAQRPDTSRPRGISPPVLPTNAHTILLGQHRQSSESGDSGGSGGSGGSVVSGSSSNSDAKTRTRTGEIKPMKPGAHETATARYSGRALAEWSQVLGECRHFYLRRKAEGVPRDCLVETPTMGVETFRLVG